MLRYFLEHTNLTDKQLLKRFVALLFVATSLNVGLAYGISQYVNSNKSLANQAPTNSTQVNTSAETPSSQDQQNDQAAANQNVVVVSQVDPILVVVRSVNNQVQANIHNQNSVSVVITPSTNPVTVTKPAVTPTVATITVVTPKPTPAPQLAPKPAAVVAAPITVLDPRGSLTCLSATDRTITLRWGTKEATGGQLLLAHGSHTILRGVSGDIVIRDWGSTGLLNRGQKYPFTLYHQDNKTGNLITLAKITCSTTWGAPKVGKPIYRYWLPATGDHIFTDYRGTVKVDSKEYKYDGLAFFSCEPGYPGTYSVSELYDGRNHLYVKWADRQRSTGFAIVKENAWLACPAGAPSVKPVYSLMKPYEGWMLTTSTVERDNFVKNWGWTSHGIKYWQL